MIILRCDNCRTTVELDHRHEEGVRQWPGEWRTHYLGGVSDRDPLHHQGVRFEFCSPRCRDEMIDRLVKDATRDPLDHRSERR